MLFSYSIVDIYLHVFDDWAVDMQIWALLPRIQCSFWYSGDCKACGPLVTNKEHSIFKNVL